MILFKFGDKVYTDLGNAIFICYVREGVGKTIYIDGSFDQFAPKFIRKGWKNS